MEEPNAYLDAKQLSTFLELHDLRQQDIPHQESFEYVKSYVLGIRSSKLTPAQAYFAAGVVAACAKPGLFTHGEGDPLPPHLGRLEACRISLVELGMPQSHNLIYDENGAVDLRFIPASIDGLADFYKDLIGTGDKVFLQRALSRHIKHILFEEVLQCSSDETKARLYDLTSPKAMAWYRATPDKFSKSFSNSQWVEVIKFTLGWPLDPKVTKCLCGHDLQNADASHFYTCVKFRSTLVTIRHNRVAKCVAAQNNKLGVVAVNEFNLGRPDSMKRPDNAMWRPIGFQLGDVHIKSVYSASAIKAGSAGHY
jgi:hypothetical protein